MTSTVACRKELRAKTQGVPLCDKGFYAELHAVASADSVKVADSIGLMTQLCLEFGSLSRACDAASTEIGPAPDIEKHGRRMHRRKGDIGSPAYLSRSAL